MNANQLNWKRNYTNCMGTLVSVVFGLCHNVILFSTKSVFVCVGVLNPSQMNKVLNMTRFLSLKWQCGLSHITKCIPERYVG